MNTFIIRYFTNFALIFYLSSVQAGTDLLNLDAYKEGDTPSYAKHIIVKKDEATGEKWLSWDDNDKKEIGQLTFPINLSGDFEMSIRLAPRNLNFDFIAKDEINKIRLDFYAGWDSSYHRVRLFTGSTQSGDYDGLEKYSGTSWVGIVQIKFSVVNKIAKIYVNDVLYKKTTLKSDLKYTKLMVTMNSTSEELYELNLGGSGNNSTVITPSETESDDNNASSTPSTTLLAAEFEKGKKAGIQQCIDNPDSCGIKVSVTEKPIIINDNSNNDNCTADYSMDGELHIPCVNVPGVFGQIETYDVWLQQETGSFNFALDLERITPK